jgi:hypothetical protein
MRGHNLAFAAAKGVEQATVGVLRAMGQQTVAEQPRTAGGGTPVRTMPRDWIAGLYAVAQVDAAVQRQRVEFTLRARGAGKTWQQLAEALLGASAHKVASDADLLAYTAFTAFLVTAGTRQPGQERTCSWLCDTCGAQITDRGPYPVDPAARELGHLDSLRAARRRTAGRPAQPMTRTPRCAVLENRRSCRPGSAA